MKNIKIILALSALVLVMFTTVDVNGQYASREIQKKHQAYVDSLKSTPYNYLLPILGKKVRALGIDMPLPFGVMVNYYGQTQDFVLENMMVGFNDTDLVDVSEYLRFNKVEGVTQAVNVRPDVWLFPFLNVYGIYANGSTETSVNLDLFPGTAYEMPLNTDVSLSSEAWGFGTTGAFGIGIMWVALDGNWSWSKLDVAKEAVRVSNFSVRVGHTFKLKDPTQNISVWTGAFRQRLASQTNGSISMSEVWPGFSDEQKDKMLDWYDSLPPLKQKSVEKLINEIMTKLPDEIVVNYSMDKSPKQDWAMIFGAQYQLNPRWIARFEGQLIGNRKSSLLSLNYRFGL